MTERFAAEGLTFSEDSIVRQTTLSHRLIEKAFKVGGEQLQQTTVATIYKTYFSQGTDIGDIEILAPLAIEVGVFKDLDEAKTWLSGSEGLGEYEQGIEKAKRARIRGVPFFKINDKWEISGAQDTEKFLQVSLGHIHNGALLIQLQVFERIASGELT